MRWLYVEKPTPRLGDVRIVKRFLLIPKLLLNHKREWEYRWLEIASIRQEYRDDVDSLFEWCDVGWHDA